MKKVFITLGVVLAVSMGANVASAQKDTEQKTGSGWSIGGYNVPNPFAKADDATPVADALEEETANPLAGLKVPEVLTDIKIPEAITNLNIGETLAAIKLPEALASIKLPEALANVRFGNPIDPSTWWDGADHSKYTPGETMAFNFGDPEFWMSIPNPKTHSGMHGAMTNPANWAQFFKRESYANMLNREVLGKWLEKDSYAVLLDPQTYAYWMQPGAYQHLINKYHYMQLLETSAYSTLVDTALNNVGLTFKAPEDSAAG